jgi:hypothetical protein
VTNLSSDTIQIRGGDTIEPNVNNTFCILSNNLNGFNTNNEGNELIGKLTIIKELKYQLGAFRNQTKTGGNVVFII